MTPIVLGPVAAAAEGLIVDPTTEDATNAQLNINDGASYVLLAHDYPEPDLDPIYASSADTEGDIPISVRPKNRVVSITVNIYGSTALDLDQKIGVLSQKVGKLNREGGTFKRTTPSGLVIVFDVLPESSMPSVTFDKLYQSRQKTTVSLRFTCKPYGRGPESAGQAFSTTTTGDTSIVIASIGGDTQALLRALITEGSSKDQYHARWGIRSKNYSSAASAATAFEAESCTLLGGSTVVTLTGSSGGGTNNAVQQATLLTDWQAMLSFQATGAGAYKSHIGDYEVEVRCSRPTSNTGSVSVALEWAEGDFTKVTRNDSVVFAADEREGDFVIARLGQVHLSKAKKGTQRWDGRIIAKSTVLGDNLKLDRIRLVPISEGAGEVVAAPIVQAFTGALARDEFDQAAGALNAKVLPVGGSWATTSVAGGADFTVEATGHTATRTASDDRFAIAGTTTFTDCVIQSDLKYDGSGIGAVDLGCIARYTDTTHWAIATVTDDFVARTYVVRARKCIGGAAILLAPTFAYGGPLKGKGFYTLRFHVASTGHWFVWLYPQGGIPGAAVISGWDSDLASGGTLASGKPGIYDTQFLTP